ncbi:MAG: porin family protein [Chromatiales bacterium]|nr:porin family protein [Chromatiales bacterium]
MEIRKIALSIMTTLSMAGVPFAGANAKGFFVGAGIGVTSADVDSAVFDSALADSGLASSTTADDGGAALRLTLGYEFNQHLAVEAGYVSFGDVDINSVVTAPVTGTVKSSTEVDGFTLGVRAGMPVTEKVLLFAKAGVFVWDAEWKTTASLSTGVGSSSFDDDGSDFTYGLGAAMAINKNMDVRIDWDRYDLGGDADLKYNIYSIGMNYRF